MSESAPEMFRTSPAPEARSRNTVQEAIDLVSGDLQRSEEELERLLESTIAIIPQVGGHLAFAGGKRFRPLVALLAAQPPAIPTRTASRSRPSASCCTRRRCCTTT